MATLKSAQAVLAILIALSGCRSGSEEHPALIGHEVAVNISREAMIAKGHDLSRYRLAELNEFASKLSPDGKEWWLLYFCSPGLAPPGCSVWVSVDRKTGNAEVSR